MAITVFNRYEKKYLMPAPVYEALREHLADFMETDAYGLHTICNLYYDTEGDLLIRRSMEKPVYKEKLRLRSYGIPTSETKVFVEMKKKYHKVVNKRRLALPLAEACAYLNEGIRPAEDSQILRELDFFLKRYAPKPALYLAYDRTALFGKEDGDFRVTFDANIRSRRTDLFLEHGDAGELLLPRGWYLMETKILGATPLWFSEILSALSIYPVSFSKYGNIFKKEHHAFPFEENMKHRNENWENQRRNFK